MGLDSESSRKAGLVSELREVGHTKPASDRNGDPWASLFL